MNDSSSSVAPVPTKNPYLCRPLSTHSSVLSTSCQSSSNHRRTRIIRKDHHNGNKKNHDEDSAVVLAPSNSSCHSCHRNSRRQNRINISPTSALQLWRLQQQQTAHHDDSSSIHLLSDQCPWTRLDAGRIHELAGAAGTAKTQLALQACVACARKGYDCFYVSLKGTSPQTMARLAHRLQQMILSSNNNNINHNDDDDDDARHDILSRIHLRGLRNGDELTNLQIFSSKHSTEQQQQQTRLLVIDSVADVFRGESDTDYPLRALTFLQLVQAWRCDYQAIPILILNQVTLNDSQPALGLTWAHCVNASFLVQHQPESSVVRTHPPKRILSLRRSPVFAPNSIPFAVQTSGCVVVPS